MEPTQLLSRLPSRLHHHAFVVRDHEANRCFFEDLLGIPLVATWCEKSFSSDLGKEIDFCHTFFGMADGSALAFFQFADPEMYELTQAERPPKIGRYDHIAFKAEPETYNELKRRLERAGEPYRESNHGYCKSIYVSSPDGLVVEFTQDPVDVAEIDAARRADAHQELARWLAGDRHTNNELRAAPSDPKNGDTSLVDGKILGKTGLRTLPRPHLGRQAIESLVVASEFPRRANRDQIRPSREAPGNADC